MSEVITEKESIIWASGHYLTEHLPDKYDEWKEEELEEHILCLIWEPFEYYSADQVWENIENLAYDFRTTVNAKLKENANEI
jgi:hypothetical protein